ncbi:hypothetical protein V6N11_067527 [Hibiscus sabdariffa]|uniref:Uncharacterized protein n=1 Tax=Hibiscus sabdariffa TaxID=183260 RepID=A0ABR2SRC4_9ROSI
MADSSGTTLMDLISPDPSPVPASTSSSSLSKKAAETTNGVRIETWQGGSGYVRFENALAVQISQIMYRDISRTTKSKEAMKFTCSETTLCSNIYLEKDDTAETYCNSAQGFGYGILSQHKGYILTDHNENTELAERTEDLIIHTEL